MLCLVTLMVFLGLLIALAPVGLAYLHQGEAGGGRAGTRDAGGSHAAACNPILATFAEDVPMGKLNQLLDRLDASIAFGPNENGAFELNVAGKNTAAVVDALNRVPDVVVIASLREACVRAP
jgi:hypothetical protein